MTTQTAQKLTTKLFIGCAITSDVRMALLQSAAYKQAKIGISDELKEQRYQNKDYLGLFLAGEKVTLQEVRTAEGHIRSKLREYCPLLNSDMTPIHLLSLVFVT